MKYLERSVICGFFLVGLYCLVEFADATFSRHSWARLDASAWASWVQAIGSIAAIIGAFAIAKNQSGQTERQRATDRFQSEADLCRTALLISSDTYIAVANVDRKFRALTNMIGTERIEELLYSLRSLSAKNLTFSLHSEVLVLQRELAFTLTAIRQYNNQVPMTPDRKEKSSKRVKAIAGANRNLYVLARNHYKLPEASLPVPVSQ